MRHLLPTGLGEIHILSLSTPICLGRAEAIQVATMLLKVQLFTRQNDETLRKGTYVQFADSHSAFYQLRVRTRLYDLRKGRCGGG